MYVYCSNNGMLFVDLLGFEKHLILIHGTDFSKSSNPLHISDWAKGSSRTAGIIAKEISVPYKNVITFNWTGANSKSARHEAAVGLADVMKNIRQKDPNAIITTAAHSHGGNVAIESTNLGAYHDNLITMGTPVRDDYIPNYNNIGSHLNVYNNKDPVQSIGGYTDIYPPSSDSSIYYDVTFSKGNGDPLIHLEAGSAGRTFPQAQNIEITSSATGLDAHGAVYNPLVLKNQVFSKQSATKRCP